MTMSVEKATLLRKPFPPESIGKLPKPYKRDSPKAQCGECGGFHGLPAVHLDYVGHAATTDRLLTVDPDWTWEPMGVDQFGLPAPDRDGNLWIRLTVCGVTRIGVGDGSSMKERIGDAIRNAAMRFGVALDLWAKEDLVEFEQAAVARLVAVPAASESPLLTNKNAFGKRFYARMGERNFDSDRQRIEYVVETIGRFVETTKDISEDEARKVLARLDEEAGIEDAAEVQALEVTQ